jgi:hypothetical protein
LAFSGQSVYERRKAGIWCEKDLQATMVESNAVYVQFGCGFSVGEGWLNFDSSPSLRLSRIPIVAQLAKVAGAITFPPGVLYGDVRDGPLCAPGTCAGLYASHVLEHLSYDDFHTALRNCFAMLKPGGILRLIVPDLEGRARQYVKSLDAADSAANDTFLRSTHLGIPTRPRGMSGLVRGALGNSAHLWMWDELSMSRKLSDVGFVAIRRCDFNDCKDPMFKRVESASRFRDEVYNVRELAMECRKAG